MDITKFLSYARAIDTLNTGYERRAIFDRIAIMDGSRGGVYCHDTYFGERTLSPKAAAIWSLLESLMKDYEHRSEFLFYVRFLETCSSHQRSGIYKLIRDQNDDLAKVCFLDDDDSLAIWELVHSHMILTGLLKEQTAERTPIDEKPLV